MAKYIFIIVLMPVLLASCHTRKDGKSQAQSIAYNHHGYDIYKVKYPARKITMYWKDDRGNKLKSISNLKNYVNRKDLSLDFATNGGMYMENNSPLGLYIENGKMQNEINLYMNRKGNFYLQPNGVFFLTDSTAKVVSTDKFNLYRDKPLYATQSGPMLVINGEINPTFTPNSSNLNIRNGVGINDSGEVVFAISEEEVNFYEFATVFRNTLKCKNALFLDGGISEMYLPAVSRLDMGGDFGVMIAVVR